MKKYLLLKLMILTILAVFSAKIGAQQFEEQIITGLPTNLGWSTSTWADFNNDGKLDILITGQIGTGKYITKLYKNNGNNVFSVVPQQFIGVVSSSIAWGDFNNDGYMDFVIAGYAQQSGYTGSSPVTLLYKNNGDETFTLQSSAVFTGISLGSVIWGDYNKDGLLDLLISGRTDNSLASTGSGTAKTTKLYKNNGNGTFTEQNVGSAAALMTALSFNDYNNDGNPDINILGYAGVRASLKNNGNGTFASSITNGIPNNRGGVWAWGDYNNDGYLDAVISSNNNGGTPSNFGKLEIFKGSKAGTLAYVSSISPVVTVNYEQKYRDGSVALGDYDNDGNIDLLTTGYNTAATFVAKVYKNSGAPNYTFTEQTDITLTGVRAGTGAWGDYDGDGKIDILVAGCTDLTDSVGVVKIYKNITSVSNTTPNSPAIVSAVTSADFNNVALTFSKATDNQTPTKALTYNIRIGKTAGGSDVMCPPQTSSNGVASIPAFGAITVRDTSATTLNITDTIKGLPAGDYNWSVQAIDGGFKTSSWPTDGTFTISKQQASNIQFSNISPTTVRISWTNGNYGQRLVFIDTSKVTLPQFLNTSMPVPIKGTTYTANNAFGSGSQLGTGALSWYCIYDGTSNFVDVTNLPAGAYVNVGVIEYSGSAGSQIYNVNATTGNPALMAPAINAKNLEFSALTETSFTATWKNGSGSGRAVFIHQGSAATNTNIPIPNNQSYNANTIFSSGQQIGNSGWYCVYNGTGTTVNVTGLQVGTTYTTRVCEYNTFSGINYLAQDTISNLMDCKPDYNAPTTQSSAIQVNAGSFNLDATWTNGDGTNRVVFISQGNSGSPTVNNNQTYTANTVFGQGTPDGSGWYCVYNGTGSSVLITGLTVNTQYSLAVYEYNGTPGFEKYLTTAATDNPFRPFTSSKLPQTISFAVLPDKVITDVPFDLTATGGASGNPVTFASSDPTVATVSGNTITIVAGGITNITASQLGNTDYADATPVMRTLTINKVPQTITFNALTAVSVGGSAFTLSATGGATGNPVTFESSNTSVATVSGNTITIIGVGTTNITASQTGNNIYADATPVVQVLTVNKATQSITFNALAAKTYGIAPFDLTATGGATGNPVTFTSSNLAVATISGSTVTILAAGTSNITASQLGDANYSDATAVVQVLTVNKAVQTITFGFIPVKYTNDPAFNLTATSSSGLPVTYTSSDTMVAKIVGNEVTIRRAGNANITAACATNTNYLVATSVVQGLMVNKVAQSITFDALPSKTITDVNFKLGATATSGLKIRYTSSDTTIAKILTGDSIHILGKGITYITATQPGDSIFLGAIPVQRALNVDHPTGIAGLKENGIMVYPNPATDKIYVAFPDVPVNSGISIYNISGGLLVSAKAENKTADIDVTKLTPGVYLVKIVTPDGVTIKQMVKQ